MIEAKANLNGVKSIMQTLFKPVHFIGSADLNTGSFTNFDSHLVFLFQVQEEVDQKIFALLKKLEIYPLEIPNFLRNLRKKVKDGLALSNMVEVPGQKDKQLENSQRKYLSAFQEFLIGILDSLEPYIPLGSNFSASQDLYDEPLLSEEELEEIKMEIRGEMTVSHRVMLFVEFCTRYKKWDSLLIKDKIRLLRMFIPIHPDNMESFIRSCDPKSNVNRKRFKCLDYKDHVVKFLKSFNYILTFVLTYILEILRSFP